MKKSQIILFIVLIFLPILVLNSSGYRLNCSGDICAGPKKLVYTFVKSKLLCNVVGGEYKKHHKGWSDGYWSECEVRNEWACRFRGGEMVDLKKQQNDGQIFLAPGSTYFCAKKK